MKYVRKLNPVQPYDIPGLEHWLEQQAAQGLYLHRHGPNLCSFYRDTPQPTRYRLDYCDTDRAENPIPGLIALYHEMGWDYVCPLKDATLYLFRTQDPHAPEPHTDPQTHAQLLQQLEQKLKRSCSSFGYLMLGFLLLTLFGFLQYGSILVALARGSLSNISLCILLLLALLYLLPAWLSWRRIHRVTAALEAGKPMTPVPTASRWNRLLHGAFLVLNPVLQCLFLAFFLLPHPQSQWSLGTPGRPGDFTPVLLTQWEGPNYRPDLWEKDGITFLNACKLKRSLLSPVRWEVQQHGSLRPEPVLMEIYWYRPLFPGLDEPLARDLLDYEMDYEEDTRLVDEVPLGPWTVTEHTLAGADYLATASNPNCEFQFAVAAGNGRALSVRYMGQEDLTDHLDEIAAMLSSPQDAKKL